MKTTVVNIRTAPKGSYTLIDRRTIFGNPFKIGPGITRKGSIDRFRTYFKKRLASDPVFRDKVLGLRGVEHIGCWCVPLGCHGSVIAEYLNSVDQAGSTACPVCHAEMELAGVDAYKCPWCGKEVDMCEDEDGY
jgi:hypothetical protein